VIRRLSSARLTRLADGDAGFTLIEMVVALGVATIALGALAAGLIAAVQGNRVSELRSRANQVAAQCMEQAMATPWSSLTVGSSSCSGVPSGFTGNRTVSWKNATTYDEKQILVAISWTAAGNSRSLTLTGLRAPTTSEVTPPYVNSSTTAAAVLTITSQGITPASEQLQSNGALSQDVTVFITTSQAASTVTLSFTTTGGSVSVPMTGANGATTWTATVHTTDAYRFNAGTESWSLVANDGSSTPAYSTLTNTLTAASASPVTLTVGSPAPSNEQLDTNYYLTSAITFSATTSAAASSVSVTWTDKNGTTQTGAMTGANGGTSWTLTLAAGSASGVFPSGTEAFSFVASANGLDSASVTKSVGLTPPLGNITVTSVVLTGEPTGKDAICVASNNSTSQTQTLTFTLANGGTTPTVAVAWTNDSNSSPSVTSTGTNGDGSVNYVATIPNNAQTKFKGSSTVFTLTVKRSDGAQAAPTATKSVFSGSSC
jgi:prepilin-type N-terminal cleavage/methylation domain-containing protein